MFLSVTAGCSVEIAVMLNRLQKENKEKQEQIERLGQIKELKGLVEGPVKSGTKIAYGTLYLKCKRNNQYIAVCT